MLQKNQNKGGKYNIAIHKGGECYQVKPGARRRSTKLSLISKIEMFVVARHLPGNFFRGNLEE